MKTNGGDLSYDQIVVACKNIGYDLTCGRCAEVFYTGGSGATCDSHCETRKVANRLRGEAGRLLERAAEATVGLSHTECEAKTLGDEC